MNDPKQKLASFALSAALAITPALALAETKSERADDKEAKREAAQYEADNTGKNLRDRDEGAVTADQQSFAGDKTEVTARIRAEIEKQEDLSTYAHNVKIITTDDGQVTLKGPVRTAAEKSTIEKVARRVAGDDRRIVNQLEIAPAEDRESDKKHTK